MGSTLLLIYMALVLGAIVGYFAAALCFAARDSEEADDDFVARPPPARWSSERETRTKWPTA